MLGLGAHIGHVLVPLGLLLVVAGVRLFSEALRINYAKFQDCH